MKFADESLRCVLLEQTDPIDPKVLTLHLKI